MNYQIKTLPSGIIIENIPNDDQKYRWYIKGTHLLHNEGKPAIEYEKGNKCWYQYDKRHRLDGPSIEYFDGSKSYYIDGEYFSEEKYCEHSKVKEYLYLKEHPELKAFT